MKRNYYSLAAFIGAFCLLLCGCTSKPSNGMVESTKSSTGKTVQDEQKAPVEETEMSAAQESESPKD